MKGKTTQTSQGMIHKASRNNPNALYANQGSTEVRPMATKAESIQFESKFLGRKI
jgi:hypothetical protein